MKQEKIQAKSSNKELIRKYCQLIRKLSGVRGNEFPEILLPAPKNELRKALEEETKIEKELDLTPALEFLDRFVADNELSFISRLINRPFLIILIYVIISVLIGTSPLWHLIVPPIFFISSGGSLLFLKKRQQNRQRGILKKLALFPITYLFKGTALGSYFPTWLSLFFFTGVHGFYTSIFENFDPTGLVLAIFALFIGYHFFKQINTLHYFIFNHYYLDKKGPKTYED